MPDYKREMKIFSCSSEDKESGSEQLSCAILRVHTIKNLLLDTARYLSFKYNNYTHIKHRNLEPYTVSLILSVWQKEMVKVQVERVLY